MVMEKLELLSPISVINEKLKQKDMKKLKTVSMRYLNHLKDEVTLELNIDASNTFGVLKMATKNSTASVVLRVLVMPDSGQSNAKPIQLGNGLRKVVLREFGLSTDVSVSKLKIKELRLFFISCCLLLLIFLNL